MTRLTEDLIDAYWGMIAIAVLFARECRDLYRSDWRAQVCVHAMLGCWVLAGVLWVAGVR